jgi:hypothetical protein
MHCHQLKTFRQPGRNIWYFCVMWPVPVDPAETIYVVGRDDTTRSHVVEGEVQISSVALFVGLDEKSDVSYLRYWTMIFSTAPITSLTSSTVIRVYKGSEMMLW